MVLQTFPNNNEESYRDYPVTHPPAEAPLCETCQKTELAYFDLSCLQCLHKLLSPDATISQVFAVMRQWNPHTQRSLRFCIEQVFEKGGHVDDRDTLTDMTLLHFSCKAGAHGVGDASIAAELVQDLLARGADLYARCRWTQMTALHYAAFFDVASVLRILLQASQGEDVDNPCSEYENGTALHIAACNVSFQAVHVLIEYGANPKIRDSLGRTAYDCIPDSKSYYQLPDIQETIRDLREVLGKYYEESQHSYAASPVRSENVTGRALLMSMGLNVGDRVVVGGRKTGMLRYCGALEAAAGLWAGVELDTPDGKNDGSVNDVQYFRCSPNYGVFVPVSRVSRLQSTNFKNTANSLNHSKNKSLQRGSDNSKSQSEQKDQKEETRPFQVNGRVQVITLDNRLLRGTIRYAGPTRFATGFWYGIELDLPEGKNNGSVQGVQYFECKEKHGMFSVATKLKKIDNADDQVDKLASKLWTEATLASSLRRSLTGRHRQGSIDSPLQVKFSQSSMTSIDSKSHSSHGTGVTVSKSSLLSRSVSLRTTSTKTISNTTGTSASELPPWQSIPVTEAVKPIPKKGNQHWLEIGMNVYFQREVGVIKYIGKVEFADGVWLGLEMRNGHGKHDGLVQGKRYFTCRAGKGLFVRPKTVTVRGINGALLVRPD